MSLITIINNSFSNILQALSKLWARWHADIYWRNKKIPRCLDINSDHPQKLETRKTLMNLIKMQNWNNLVLF
ncbi:unnamed protein product [Moneuplotes crassus]|uniref:Uncharacterized protein n=1 Tax=Euplotes crassus TaxID=5936 RepID=A0AAD1XTF1_EUPCR|nr:unnamed protein product [Moneuplotes crassus]